MSRPRTFTWGASAAASAAPTDFNLASEQNGMLADIISQLSQSGDLRERQAKRERLEERLDKVSDQLAALVDEHHDSFLNSLHAFFDVVGRVDNAKARVQSLRNGLTQCKSLLQCKRDHIRSLWVENLEQTEVLRLLDKIDEVRRVPDRLNSLLHEKRHMEAAKLLVETISALEGEALDPVKALGEIYDNLIKRRETMHETLVNEIHDIVYLKHPSEDSEPTDTQQEQALALAVSALALLKKVPEGVRAIHQQIKVQLSLVIEKAVIYVEDNFTDPQPEATSTESPAVVIAASTNPSMLAAQRPAANTVAVQRTVSAVLPKYCDYLTERLVRVFRAHLAVIAAVRETSVGESAVADCPKMPGGYNEATVWNAMQAELELLLQLYLEEVEDSSHLPSTSGAPLLLLSAKRKEKKATVPLFSFSNSLNAITETTVHKERSLRQSISGASADFSPSDAMDDKYTNQASQSQRLVCTPGIRNIAGMLKPVLGLIELVEPFLGRASPESLGTSGLRTFIDTFVRQVFIEHTREDLRTKIKVLNDTPEKPGDFRTRSNFPPSLLQSTFSVHTYAGQLCYFMLDMPTYSQEFAKSLHSLLKQYLGICRFRFSLVVRSPRSSNTGVRKGNAVLSSEFQKDVRTANSMRCDASWGLIGGRTTMNQAQANAALAALGLERLSETDLLLEMVGEQMLDKRDCLFDANQLRSLGYLGESITWLAGQVKGIVDRLRTDPNALLSLWPDTAPAVQLNEPQEEIHPVTAHLQANLLNNLQSISDEFLDLAESSLMCLRLEIRCHCMQFLLPAIHKSNYFCDIDAVEADPLVVLLNKDLCGIDEALSTCLPPKKLEYLFHGLDHFIAQTLIKSMKFIRRVNIHGVRRMCRSIFALQQSLTSITKTRASALDRAMQYYEYLTKQPEEVLRLIVANGPAFSEEEYRVVLKLIACSQVVEDHDVYQDNIEELAQIFHRLV